MRRYPVDVARGTTVGAWGSGSLGVEGCSSYQSAQCQVIDACLYVHGVYVRADGGAQYDTKGLCLQVVQQFQEFG